MDYSNYTFKYNGDNIARKPHKPFSLRSHVKTNFGSIALIAIIIACLITSLILAEKFSDTPILNELVVTLTKKDELRFYLVCFSPISDKNQATLQATKARLGGAAGYVIKENEYYVVLAVYADKKSADTVVFKNENTVIKETSFNKKELLNSYNDDKLTKKCLDSVESTIFKLLDLSTALAQNEASESDILLSLNDDRNALLTLKEEVIEANPKHKEMLLNIIDPVYGSLDALVQMEMHNTLLAELRYVTALSVVTLTRVSVMN